MAHLQVDHKGGRNPRELFQGEVAELGRFNYGYFQIFSKVLADYGLDKTFSSIGRKHKLSCTIRCC